MSARHRGEGWNRLARLRRAFELRTLAFPAAAVIIGLSLFLSTPQVTARSQPQPLPDSYRFESDGDWPHAVEAQRLVAQRKPQDYFATLRLGYLEYKAGRYSEAAADYEVAVHLAPNALDAKLGLLLARIAEKSYPAALETAEAILARDPRNYLARSRKAWALYESQKFREAVAAYSSVLDDYPGDIEMRLGRAYALFGAKRPVESEMEFREVLQRVPSERRARLALGLP
jgi:tetratricopeptide (TPR) repeat protein